MNWITSLIPSVTIYTIVILALNNQPEQQETVEESQTQLIPLETYSTIAIELAHQLLDFDCTNHKYATHLIGNAKQQTIREVTSNNLCPANLNQTGPASQGTQSSPKLAKM